MSESKPHEDLIIQPVTDPREHQAAEEADTPGPEADPDPESGSELPPAPIPPAPTVDPEMAPERDAAGDVLEFEKVQRRRPKRRRGRWLLVLALVIAVGAAAWARWGPLSTPTPGDEIPVVRADVTPIKVKPEEPGGLQVPNRDKLVYDRLESQPAPPRTESLLPKPETPMTPPAATPEAAQPPAPAPEKPAEIPAETAAAAPAPAAKKPAPAPAAPAADTVPRTAHPTPQEVETAAKPAPPPPPEVKKEAPAQQVAAAKPAGATYRIQLAAVRDEQAARTEWSRLKGLHPELLGKLELQVVRADLGSKGIFYRLRAGPLADQAAAETLCGELKKAKLGCLVIRPGS